MKLEYSFTRTEADFGLDVAPTDAAYLALDNVFNAPQYGVFEESIESIAFAYEVPIAGGVPATAAFYLWDEESLSWYLFATDAIDPGDIHYIPLPNVIDRKDTRYTSRIDVAIVVAPVDDPPDGTYTFSFSSSTSMSTEQIEDLLISINALLVSIDNTIENPMPIEGATAVGDQPVSDPLDLGAVVLAVDPGVPYTDGDIQRLRLDSLGRLMVVAGGALGVEGVVSDDDAVGATKPVVIGGVYISDPTIDQLEADDAGWALLNAQRMLVVDNRAVVQNTPPVAMLDGTYYPLRLDDVGRLIVTDPAASPYVEGPDPDGDPVTGQPVQVGGVYYSDPTATPLLDGDVGYMLLNAQRMVVVDNRAVVEEVDPAPPLAPNDLYHLRLDTLGRLIVTDPAASPFVEGPDADDTAVTGNPVQVGGVYYSDPTSNPIDSGDVGYLLINELRMLINESRTYDAASDADKNIPVWNPTDLWVAEDLSGTRTSDGKSYFYVSLEEYSRYSIQFIPAPANDETIDIRIYQSNEDDPDITARTYTDITLAFFGADYFRTESWIETQTPTRAKSLRVDVTVSGYTAGTTAWAMYLMKGGNS